MAMQTSSNPLSKQLLEASKNGNDDKVRSLLSQGAAFTTNGLGMSPLHFSCMNGHVSTTQILTRAGVSWEGRTKADKTPLHFAAQYGHHEIVGILVKLGADIDALDMLQMTALHWAVVEEHFLVVKILVNNRADISIKNKFDKSPLDSAQDSCNYHFVEYLKSSLYHQTYEDEISTTSPAADSSQSVLASLAALSGSPSLTDSLPWLNQDSVASGASVLLEGANMITITEAGKLALQAWSNIYEDETNKESEISSESSIVDGQDNGQKVLSIALANQMLNAPTQNNSTANQHALRFVVTPPSGKTKSNERKSSPNKRKRKLSSQDQSKDQENDIEPLVADATEEQKDLQRHLAEAQLEASKYREKLRAKEQEARLWKKRIEIIQRSGT